jgi:hypothetical protein
MHYIQCRYLQDKCGMNFKKKLIFVVHVTKLEMFLTVGKTFLVPMKTGLIKDRPLE